MAKKIELLAPGGDISSVKAAIAAGADAVYCGLSRFNARNRAENLSFEELCSLIRLAHANDCQLFLTLNILIVEPEIPALCSLLNKLVNSGIDGVIVQDLGLLYLLKSYFQNFKVHGSTQLTTHNSGQLKFLNHLNVQRVNLSRELSLKEIEQLTDACHEHNMLSEVFVHGSHCLGFSGLCYMSSVQSGNSGNRGRCSQPCRDQYQTTLQGSDFPLNLKDISVFDDVHRLKTAGVDSVKIEGRIKKSHYVFSVVEAWKKQLKEQTGDDNLLQTMFNRGFSSGFLNGQIGAEMYSENIRDNSAKQLLNQATNKLTLKDAKKQIYDTRTAIIQNVEQKIEKLGTDKQEVTIQLTGKPGNPLEVRVTTQNRTFSLFSKNKISPDQNKRTSQIKLSRQEMEKAFSLINTFGFSLKPIFLEDLDQHGYLSASDITPLKRQLLVSLNQLEYFTPAVEIPKKKRKSYYTDAPSLSIIISSKKDIELTENSDAHFYFQLPEYLEKGADQYVDLFRAHKQLTPVFPSILLENSFLEAVKILQQLQPTKIITNNSGIAYYSCKLGIPWIAGPYMNATNSLSLDCLKREFNCSGAFLSSELSRMQLKLIQPPDQFELYYSIFHPLLLMTSRQCLFQQVTGCTKERVDGQCIQLCSKSASLTNLKGESFQICKVKNNHNKLYATEHFLNLDILPDIPHRFTSFCIDMSTKKQNTLSKAHLISLFQKFLNNNTQNARGDLQTVLPATVCSQYKKGI